MTTNPIFNKQKTFIRSVLDPKDCLFCLQTSTNIVKNSICKCQYYYHYKCASLNINNSSYKCPLCRTVFIIDLETGSNNFHQILKYTLESRQSEIVTSPPLSSTEENCRFYVQMMLTILATMIILYVIIFRFI